jgi:hypothetical protein
LEVASRAHFGSSEAKASLAMTALTKRRFSEEECLLIDRVFVEHWMRDAAVPHVWTVREYSQLSDRLRLETLGVELGFSEIYDKVDFRDRELTPR